MKIAVSIPDEVFTEAEKYAKKAKVSRSKMYAKALEDFLEREKGKEITRQLNDVYRNEDSSVDPVLHALQLKTLPKDEW